MASKRNKKRGAKPKRRPKKALTKRRLVRLDGGPNAAADVAQEVLSTERASASVLTPANDTNQTHELVETKGIAGPFPTLLEWFSAVATHPRSAADGVAAAAQLQADLSADRIEAIVKPTDRMSAVERMGIYQYAYHARLVGCLEDDYPGASAAIGPAQFELLARKYIQAHPSDRPNLNSFGRHFAAFCGEQQGWLDQALFLRDLAQLEWAMVEVIHAPTGEPVSMDALQATPPERWSEVRLPPSPTLRFLQLDYPANAFLQAQREGQSPPIPTASWSTVAVYRQNYRIWRMGFTKPMAAVLQTLIDGGTLGEALGRLADPGLAAQIGESDVMVWFKEWVISGFFADVIIPE